MTGGLGNGNDRDSRLEDDGNENDGGVTNAGPKTAPTKHSMTMTVGTTVGSAKREA